MRRGLHARRPHASGSRATCRRSSRRASRRTLATLPGRPGARRRPRASSAACRSGHRGRHRREGDARDRDLLRPPDRGDALAPRLRGALPRAHLARRAPLLDVAPLPAHPRGARHELRRLRLHRGVPARHVPVLPRPEHRRGARSSSRSGSGRWCRRTRTWRCASRSTSCGSSIDERALAGRLRGDARLPDEERVRDDRDARTSSSATRSTRSGTASREFTSYMRERLAEADARPT